MGIDLRLLPCEHWTESNGRVWGFSHTILELGRMGEGDYEAFEKMVKPHVTKMPVGHDVSSYVGRVIPDGQAKGERYYGKLRDKDAYGTVYEVVTAQHLLPWVEAYFSYDGNDGSGMPYGPYQTAIAAYIRALPPDTKIVLDWH
jgi:hypothetical protein